MTHERVVSPAAMLSHSWQVIPATVAVVPSARYVRPALARTTESINAAAGLPAAVSCAIDRSIWVPIEPVWAAISGGITMPM